MAIVSSGSLTPTSNTGTSIAGQEDNALSKLNGNFDSFLKLLTTQLKNQDPMDPVDTAQFTQQLVQFASVEQLIKQSTLMEKLIASQEQTQALQATQLSNHFVQVPGAEATLLDGAAQWTYTLADKVANVTLQVRDKDGNLVNSISGSPDKGAHAVVWDGSQSSGGTAPDGTYTLRVVATDTEGKAVNATIQGFGLVDRVNLDEDGAKVVVGGKIVPVSQITAIW